MEKVHIELNIKAMAVKGLKAKKTVSMTLNNMLPPGSVWKFLFSQQDF